MGQVHPGGQSRNPLTLCACGLLFTFRIGLWNIGVEGQVVIGSVFTTWALRAGVDSPDMGPQYIVLSLAASAWAGRCGRWSRVAAAVAVFSIFLRQNQVAVGFVLTLMTRDLAYFLGNPYSRLQGHQTAPAPIPGLDQIPFLGPVLFNHSLPVYFSVALIGTARAGRGAAALFIGNGAGGVGQALSAGLSQGRARKSLLDIVWPNG